MSVMRIKDAQGNWQEVAALHGLPGTSVSITSISQSTEDDGYSVVTFSDGKTLRVKNGSKGSPGEGGSGGGGGVMTVACTPTEDGTSFTADKSFEEIGDALLRGQAVQAYVQGMNAVAQMFMFSDDMVVFSAVASLMGDNAAVTLMMMKNGTNTMSVTSLGGTCIVNISTGDDVNGTADMTGPELFEAASMGQPVYANFNGGMYAPAQLIASTYAVFRIEIPSGVIMATIDEQGAVAIELSEGGSAGGGGGNVVAVTLTYDGNTVKPSHTSNEIYNLTQAGNAVLLRYGAKTFMPITIGDAKCVFENMSHESGALGAVNSNYTTVTITADVVTIEDYNSQTVYPNPKPLTINGTSYDGSEAVNIDIAAGGGGNKWELIETITISSDVTSINRTKDLNGATYSLAAAMIRADCGATATGGYVRVYFRGTSSYIEIHIDAAVGGTSLSWTAECCQECGMMIGKATTPRNGSRDAASYIPPRYGYDFIPAEPIKKIELVTNSKFAVGTKIEIWGVRA